MNNSLIVDPNKFISYLRDKGYLQGSIPKTVIIIFLKSLMEDCKKNYRLNKTEGFDAGELYILSDYKSIGIFYCRGIGAPVAVINLEELIAFGVQNFIVIGTSGALSLNLSIADIILCNSALREEGTSRHYISDGYIFSPTEKWHNDLKTFLNTNIPLITEGRTWTTDAPYRETKSKVMSLQQQGVLCVEMEASALFAVAEFHKVNIASVFVISDSLADLTWKPHFFSEKVTKSLIQTINYAVKFSDNIKD
ncbi:nucleoside phosphorylase [Providencia burhodogranariea]|uniref:Uridine phosphorylase n=1 Tax=Providencia burhodogranariea DSM 19968 TaxID=1141662 RepID=K8VXP2_9GAMM|nr:nucleoside phosphorylase [Providencia burhodogranariea]EKT52909.1 purine-nucleoside phosphorylase [Providencia burhodogranariea DSM 19968]